MQRLTLLTISCALAMLLSDSLVHAQPPGGRAGQGGGRQRGEFGGQVGPGGRGQGQRGPGISATPLLLPIFDTDRDGQLSANEIDAAVGVLQKLDRDGDGSLSGEELRPDGAGGPQGRQRARGPGASGRIGGKRGQQGGQLGGGGPGAGRRPGGNERRGGNQGAGAGQRGGPRDRVSPRDIRFNEVFSLGTQLPDDLKVYDVDRNLVPMKNILKSKYTAIVSGCLTCPAFRNSYPEIEAVARDFKDQGVDFYFVYQSLAHPENWGYVQPSSIEDRFAQVEHAEELLQTKIPWLTDPIGDPVKTHFMGSPNAQFVFDQAGKVVHRDSWGRGSSLRESLETLVGKPTALTTVDKLKLPRFGRHLTSERDMLLQRVQVNGVAVPLRVKAGGETTSVASLLSTDFNQSNRYVKLRPEADQQLIATGTGKLYLGFRQDPVLGAKWNNLADPPAYKIVADGVTVSPATGQAKQLEVESDDEPREFLIDVKDWEPGKPIVVKLQYFGCNKEKGWCQAVEQEFTVWLESDPSSGKVSGRSHFPGAQRGGGQRGRGQAGGNQRPGRGRARTR